MEHLFLKILPFVSLAALTLSGTALVSAAPAQTQGRGGYTQIDGDDDFDTPRVPRRILGDDEDDLPRARSRGVVGDGDEDTRIEWRIIERRVVAPSTFSRAATRAAPAWLPTHPLAAWVGLAAWATCEQPCAARRS